MSRDNLSPLIASGRLDLQNWIPVMPNADSVPRFCGSSMTRRSSTRILTWLLLRGLTENHTTAQKTSGSFVMKSIKASKNRTAARQDIMESYEEINRNIQSSRDAILEAHATPQDIRESCDEMKQSIKQSHDAILEAQVTRRPSPPPSILLNGPKKPRKRKGAHDIRVTSALHRRKPSWQGSIGLVKAFTQLCGSKSREVFRSATKSAHPRSASEGVLPLQRTFFQHGAGTRLHPIDEQNAVDTMAGRLLGQDYQSSRHKAYISELPNSKNRLRKRPGDDKVRAAFSLSSQEIFIASKRRHCQGCDAAHVWQERRLLAL
ncbi:hypothetical protein KCU71_g1363, partial [Aureobasidium melanogenum]